jgi:protein-L-isoaspartate(D-aspartate) O-methyltransferase
MNNRVLQAMRRVPRHKFVPPKYKKQSYEDCPLPIGYGQTTSQPHLIAGMIQLLDLHPGERVLEIGTGSGYQTAILAELGDVEVFTIEIIPELAESVAARLKDLGYAQVHLNQGDGYCGWAEYAPFNAIIVTAAPDHLPTPLTVQLAEGGRIVIPIGPPGCFQTLWKFVKKRGKLTAFHKGEVCFVPFTGLGIQEHRTKPTP